MAQRDFRSQPLKVGPSLGMGGGLAQVAIENRDALGRPAEGLRAFDQGALIELTIQVLTDLFDAGLADIDDRRAFQVNRRDFNRYQANSTLSDSST